MLIYRHMDGMKNKQVPKIPEELNDYIKQMNEKLIEERKKTRNNT